MSSDLKKCSLFRMRGCSFCLFVFLCPAGKMASNDSNINDEIMEKVHVSVIDFDSVRYSS